MATTVDHADLGDLSERITGTVLRPHDSGYDQARSVHNGLIDRKPALIVRCRTADDVVAALAFAGRAELEVSIRGGGHNVAGRAVTDGGLMIDLAEMKAIAVDPQARTVTAEGGVIWNELNDATAEHGLAVTGGVISTTGIAGLTLGGGLGWLMSKYGLAADNLSGVELVTGDGAVLEADAKSHPELFWALRGGGGNFGVVTSLTYRLHPLRTIVGGLIAHPIDAAPAMLRFYRDAVADASDDGAVTRVDARATAVPHRAEGWNLFIPSVWTDAADSDENIAWTRETFAAMQPHFGTGRWLNYLGDDEADDAVRAAYGPNYERLREVKRRYDPEKVFHLNHNIR